MEQGRLEQRPWLSDEKNGNRVLLTTRNKEIAVYADPRCPPHELQFLGDGPAGASPSPHAPPQPRDHGIENTPLAPAAADGAPLESRKRRATPVVEVDSLELLCRRAFLGDDASRFPVELEKTGRKIMAKCGSLPLTIVMMGGRLSRREQLYSTWQLREGRDQISSILVLSYDALPYYLEPCLLCFGCLPGRL